MSNRTREENKRGDRKEKSNDSPEIPDLSRTADITSVPSRDFWTREGLRAGAMETQGQQTLTAE